MIDDEEAAGFADSGAWEVPLSALERYAYCPRQAAMVHVEGAWTDNADTVRGELSHQNVDLPGLTRRAGVTAVRSLPVSSEVYGLLITYDVETTTPAGERRLRRVAKICEAYGHRVQKSVFEVVCRETDKVRLVAALQKAIDPVRDSIRIYRLPPNALDDVEHLGRERDVEPRGSFVI